MVISQIIGGLGNQMFQYAAGRALSLERNQSLQLDVSGFCEYGLHHGFELQRVFMCVAEISTDEEVCDVLGWQYPSVIRRVVARPLLSILCRKSFIIEPYFHYWSEIKNVPRDCYLSGYWQSEKYFQDFASVIRADFTFQSPLTGQNSGIAEQISEVNAVSLHVRRGDYVSNSKNQALYTSCSLDYYQAAIQYISAHVENPNFFVFSDDPTWVKRHLKTDFPCQYIEHNHGSESYNDMHLMSLCQHQIIANSSFSWWGAWLNVNPDKIVIAPKKWFSKERNTQDLIPQGWVRL